MISELWPASGAQLVSFSNFAPQAVMRVSTWGFEPCGVTGASKGSGVPFARAGCPLCATHLGNYA